VYTALCFVSLSYVYFCVGEVTGRTMEEIGGYFRQVGFHSKYIFASGKSINCGNEGYTSKEVAGSTQACGACSSKQGGG
jgi:hypothetical protein